MTSMPGTYLYDQRHSIRLAGPAIPSRFPSEKQNKKRLQTKTLTRGQDMQEIMKICSYISL